MPSHRAAAQVWRRFDRHRQLNQWPKSKPTPKEIAQAERALGIIFPPTYREYLDRYGNDFVPGFDTCWIGKATSKDRDIIEENAWRREKQWNNMPDFLVAFADDGNGDVWCFDTRSKGPDGEFPIVVWGHEEDHEKTLRKLKTRCESFIDWVDFRLNDVELV